MALAAATLGERVDELLALRSEATRRYFDEQALPLARLCHRLAERFARGGRLLALGRSPQARSDARHVAVEFVHPVIVGKRALPAVGLAPESGPLELQLELLAAPGDAVLAFEPEPDALAAARGRGCLTVAFAEGDADWQLEPGDDDPFVRQELVETAYHVLWELVHVFFEHRGLLEGRTAGPVSDAGRASFLYPFLAEREKDADRVVEDVARSVRMKAEAVADLRRQTLEEARTELVAAARTLRRAFDRGGTALVFGNGGSATDAMDLVADLHAAPQGWPARKALDLTADTAILTALANDIGAAVLFGREVIAYGHAGDVAVAFTTSGGSANIVEALAEARRRGLGTIAFVGYDGGRIAAERLADHVVVSRSEHVPRIQEAQASAYHVVRELVELAGEE